MTKNLKVNSILYVEDENKIQEELSEVLEQFCNILYLAENGEKGLEEFKKYNPDIVISDIRMPKMNGIEMCKLIKEVDKNKYIIFTTAFNDTNFLQEAIELQVDGYILKPIDLDILENKLEKIINGIKLKEELKEKEYMLIQQSKLASMGEMVNIIAHQWRQPLNVLSLKLFSIFSDFQNSNLTEESMQSHYEIAYDIISDMSKIIDTFRDFVKNKKLEEILFDNIINDTLKFVDNLLKLNSINFIYENNNIKIKALQSELTQVILNIVKNSIDELQTKDIKDKFIKIETFNDEKFFTIFILDNGGGVDEKILTKIFEPYFSTKSENGTGLGLYMCKLIIEKHLSGTISAKNENSGLKIIIKIPIDIDSLPKNDN